MNDKVTCPLCFAPLHTASTEFECGTMGVFYEGICYHTEIIGRKCLERQLVEADKRCGELCAELDEAQVTKDDAVDAADKLVNRMMELGGTYRPRRHC